MAFAQPLLFLLMASVTNGLPLTFNGRFGPVRTIQGGITVTTSTISTLVTTPPSEKFIATGSRSVYTLSSDTLWNKTTTETSASIDSLTTDSPSSFPKTTSTSSVPFSTTRQTISSPSTMISCTLATTQATAIAHTPTITIPLMSGTPDPHLTAFYLLYCPNTTTTNNNNNEKVMTQIYQFKLLATVLGALYALVQLCETQVITTTRRFLTDMVKAIYSRGKRSIINTIAWLKRTQAPSN